MPYDSLTVVHDCALRCNIMKSEKSVMDLSQLNSSTLKEFCDSFVASRKRSDCISFYLSLARWSSLVLRKAFASKEIQRNQSIDIQNYNINPQVAIAVKALIDSINENPAMVERHLLEVAHELNSDTKESNAYLRILCATALGAKEFLRILPSMIDLVCSENTITTCHGEIELLVAIAIEINKCEKNAQSVVCCKPTDKESDLSLDVKKYMQARKVDPLFPRIISDQIQLRDLLRNAIMKKLIVLDIYPHFSCNDTQSPVKLTAKQKIFSEYTYNNNRTNAQMLKLLNYYIREMDVRRIFISYPKCGRTWLRMMLSEIDPSKDFKFTHLMANPLFFTRKPEQFALPSYKKDLSVFLHRDPRDVVVSQFHQIHQRDMPHKEGLGEHNSKKLAISDFVKYTLPPPKSIEEFVFCPHWGFNRIAKFNLCVLKSCDVGYIWSYENMMIYPKLTMSDLCSFLELEATQSHIYNAIENCRFGNMLSKELSSDESNNQMFPKLYDAHDLANINARKVRKGRIGGWKDEIDKDCHSKLTEMANSYYSALFDVCSSSAINQLYVPEDIAFA